MPICPDTRNVSYVTLSYHIADKVSRPPPACGRGQRAQRAGEG